MSEDSAYDRTYFTGPEMQILDDDKHKDGKIFMHTSADCYDLYEAVGKELKPVGEWNHVKLVVDEGHVEHHFNGKKVVDYQLWSDEWRAKVDSSKFSKWKDYGLIKSGKIALQDHGDRVWFRNIRIKSL